MPEGDAPASDATSALPPGHPLADATAPVDDQATTTISVSVDEGKDAETALAEALAELDKWKNLSKKNEGLAKANKAAIDELRRRDEAAMSESEKAVAAARREGRIEALAESGARVVEATFRAAARDRLEAKSIDTLLASIDRRTFMDDEGNVDTEAIVAFVESIAPPPARQEESKDPRWPDLGQGQQGDPPLNSSGLERALMQTVNRA